MGRTVCTEPQCLYKGALYLYLYSYYFINNHITLLHNRYRVSETVAALV